MKVPRGQTRRLAPYGRAPVAEEKRQAEAFLERQRERTGSRQLAFAEMVRALWNSNEFLYVD